MNKYEGRILDTMGEKGAKELWEAVSKGKRDDLWAAIKGTFLVWGGAIFIYLMIDYFLSHLRG